MSATRSGMMSVGMLAGGVACSGKLELLSGTIEWNKIASDQSQVAYIEKSMSSIKRSNSNT